MRPGLFGFLVGCMLLTKAAVLAELELLRSRLLVLGGGVVALLALDTGKRNNVSHCILPL